MTGEPQSHAPRPADTVPAAAPLEADELPEHVLGKIVGGVAQSFYTSSTDLDGWGFSDPA